MTSDFTATPLVSTVSRAVLAEVRLQGRTVVYPARVRLYLSSSGLPHPAELAALLGRASLASAKVGLIPNAREHRTPDDTHEEVLKAAAELAALELEVELLDLREQTEETMPSALAGLDLLWVIGGDLSCLRYRMRRAGFDRAGASAVEQGLVYAGESAGAIVAGPSLSSFPALDDSDAVEERISDGLRFVPFVVVPHWRAPGFEESAPAALRAARELGFEAIPLEDGQALVVDGQKVRMLY